MRQPGRGIHNEDYGNAGLKVKRKPLLISLCNVVLSKWIRKDKRSTNTEATASVNSALNCVPTITCPLLRRQPVEVAMVTVYGARVPSS